MCLYLILYITGLKSNFADFRGARYCVWYVLARRGDDILWLDDAAAAKPLLSGVPVRAAVSSRQDAALLVFSRDLSRLIFLRLPICGDGDLGFSSFASVAMDRDLLRVFYRTSH